LPWFGLDDLQALVSTFETGQLSSLRDEAADPFLSLSLTASGLELQCGPTAEVTGRVALRAGELLFDPPLDGRRDVQGHLLPDELVRWIRQVLANRAAPDLTQEARAQEGWEA